jgi:hypothetical protein
VGHSKGSGVFDGKDSRPLRIHRAMSCVESFGRIAVPDGGAGCFCVDWLGKIRIKLE